jgi:hypothetical protein
MTQIRQITSRSQNDINYKFTGVFKNCIYNGTNDKTTLTANQLQLYSILIPLPTNSYDISEFTQYSKIQLEPFFIQTATGSTSGHSFSLYTGDGTLSHFHTSINSAGGGAAAIPTLAQIMNNDLVALGIPHFVNATRATQHLDMNSKKIFNVASIDGYTVRTITAGNSISITEPSTGSYTINYVPTTIGWTNDIKINNGSTGLIQMNPTLTSSLDINNYVYEVQIETWFSQAPPYLMISFNEVFTNLATSTTQSRHGFSSQMSRLNNPNIEIVSGEIYINNNASWYIGNQGEMLIHGYIRPLRSTQNGGSGTNNQNLGVLFHGQSWYNRKSHSSNNSPIEAWSHSNFHKLVYATPLIDRVNNPTGNLANINYISLNTDNVACMRSLRIRTRIHSTIDRN